MLKEQKTQKNNNVGMTDTAPQKGVQRREGTLPVKQTNKPELVRVRTGVDRIFLLSVILLLCIGSVMVFSAGYSYSQTEYGDSYYLIKRQIAFAFIGILVMVVAMRCNYKIYSLFSVPMYLLAMGLLALVIVMGSVGGGAQRWLVIPGIGVSFQPSEIAKLAIVLMLAKYMSNNYEKINDYKNFKNYFGVGICGPLALLMCMGLAVVLEKHFSGLIIITLIGVVIMFAGGSKWNWLLGFGIAAVAVITVAVLTMGYSSERIVAWLDPWSDPLGSGWQTLQGMKAIGSGGFFGLGLGNSRLKYGYVSMPHNDFIFAIVCEELGYIGALAVIALFGVLIWRGFVIAMKAPDTFSSLVAIGITSKVAIQTIFNIAVVTKVIPNTGISE